MKNYFGKEIPQLNESQCSLIQAEAKTGQVLTTEGNKRFVYSEEPFILIFDSLDEARTFSKNVIA